MLHVRQLAKWHGVAPAHTPVFAQVDLDVAVGEFVAIVGESGVGKSTLLNCLAGLDTPSAGTVTVLGTELTRLDEAGQAHFRRRHLGFVFQAFHVLPHLSVAQNVALPLMLLGAPRAQQAARVAEELAAVGLDSLGERLPQQLSGGQLQRVALARALVHRPALILADEPTGNLDPDTAERVMALLARQTRQHGAACIMVTHSQAAAAHADRVLRLTPTGVLDTRGAAHG
ncbi:MAG: ABC transporter ATP-binding protein [Proteobacteria bacterium]|uniref:ABC transporter ATP-binding protein n=1 Tax=Aquabacterium sp. TaxID=1872578 RepID=UPI0035C70E3A|nr:ABC transporter ATP-binding protein [Pseudomonadota bacterium]